MKSLPSRHVTENMHLKPLSCIKYMRSSSYALQPTTEIRRWLPLRCVFSGGGPEKAHLNEPRPPKKTHLKAHHQTHAVPEYRLVR